MTTAQKIIKYFAIAFAIFLIVTIISTILGGLFALSGVLGLKNDNEINISQMQNLTFQDLNINSLEIDVNYTNLTIKTGNVLSIETNNTDITAKQNNEKLEIKEKKHNWFFNNEELDLIIYIPENLKFEEVKLTTGAGKISIDNLNTQKLSFELGAGETEIRNLKVSRECDIEGGAGKVSILAGTINNLDLGMGIGEVNLTAMLEGESEIDAGIGSLNITLEGDKENYRIKTKKGIGSVKIDGEEMEDNQIFGDGKNRIEINGGIGNIRVEFK